MLEDRRADIMKGSDLRGHGDFVPAEKQFAVPTRCTGTGPFPATGVLQGLGLCTLSPRRAAPWVMLV